MDFRLRNIVLFIIIIIIIIIFIIVVIVVLVSIIVVIRGSKPIGLCIPPRHFCSKNIQNYKAKPKLLKFIKNYKIYKSLHSTNSIFNKTFLNLKNLNLKLNLSVIQKINEFLYNYVTNTKFYPKINSKS